MNLEWLKTGIGPLKDLLTFLNKEGKTSDVLKKQVIRELRNNLNIFHNAFLNEVSADVMIDMLSNETIKKGVESNFKFNKLKSGSIEQALLVFCDEEYGFSAQAVLLKDSPEELAADIDFSSLCSAIDVCTYHFTEADNSQ